MVGKWSTPHVQSHRCAFARLRCMASAVSLFRAQLTDLVEDLAEKDLPRRNRRLEMLWDRLCIRHRGWDMLGPGDQ